ncbi:MAG TPA: methyltransferase domain-containing protein [Pseudonocardiaceae bacterium]|nr:methyltransferase domain-containing protein [Pseudonocardiaceae bacterium]
MTDETDRDRGLRQHRRTLFDGAAGLYQRTRPGYSDSIVRSIADTAGLGAGADVLELGCGTGQLTERLARAGFSVTAIDIGSSMIAVARSFLDDLPISLQVSSYEDFAAADASFDLIVSAAAFHWIDPEVKYAKSARLLRPGGWLAVLDGGETYDEPFGTRYHQMWVARSADGEAWVKRQQSARSFDGSTLFGSPVEMTEMEADVRPVEDIVGVESTRAISLAWPHDERRAFADEIRRHLRGTSEVRLTRETTVTMAQVRLSVPEVHRPEPAVGFAAMEILTEAPVAGNYVDTLLGSLEQQRRQVGQ